MVRFSAIAVLILALTSSLRAQSPVEERRDTEEPAPEATPEPGPDDRQIPVPVEPTDPAEGEPNPAPTSPVVPHTTPKDESGAGSANDDAIAAPSPFEPIRPEVVEPEAPVEPEATPVPESPPAAESLSIPRTDVQRLYGGAGQRFELSVDGFLRVNLACIYPNSFCGIDTPAEADARRNPFVGRNDLFSVGAARVNLRGRYGDRLSFRLALEGAGVTYRDSADPVGRLDTAFQDSYLGYALTDEIDVYVGRFRPPFDAEALTAVENLFFVNRSLESRGVPRHEGWSNEDFNGFAPGRQLGVMVAGEHGDEMRWAYQLAITNGNSGQASLNDNDLPAVYGRVSFSLKDGPDRFDGYHRADEEGPASYHITDGLTVGVGGFYNEVSSGLPPARFNDRLFGVGLDVAAKYSMFVFQGQILTQRIQHLTRGDSADEQGFGGHAQLSVDVLDSGFYPGYRFAILDPREAVGDVSVIETADSDRVVHHTIGVKWISKTLPLIGFLEYTVALEQEGRELPNDRIEAALQVIFE
ncbi:MAG: porin [Myxococcota bacterium]